MKTIWNILMGHAAGAANRGTKHQFIGLTPLPLCYIKAETEKRILP